MIDCNWFNFLVQKCILLLSAEHCFKIMHYRIQIVMQLYNAIMHYQRTNVHWIENEGVGLKLFHPTLVIQFYCKMIDCTMVKRFMEIKSIYLLTFCSQRPVLSAATCTTFYCFLGVKASYQKSDLNFSPVMNAFDWNVILGGVIQW